jgi:hypothetical protein
VAKILFAFGLADAMLAASCDVKNSFLKTLNISDCRFDHSLAPRDRVARNRGADFVHSATIGLEGNPEWT